MLACLCYMSTSSLNWTCCLHCTPPIQRLDKYAELMQDSYAEVLGVQHKKIINFRPHRSHAHSHVQDRPRRFPPLAGYAILLLTMVTILQTALLFTKNTKNIWPKTQVCPNYIWRQLLMLLFLGISKFLWACWWHLVLFTDQVFVIMTICFQRSGCSL